MESDPIESGQGPTFLRHPPPPGWVAPPLRNPIASRGRRRGALLAERAFAEISVAGPCRPVPTRTSEENHMLAPLSTRRRWLAGAALVLAAVAAVATSRIIASDHRDSTLLTANPTVDIADVYSFR